MQAERDAEVFIVGTGIGGLAAAKTYLELSPDTELLLIEKSSSLGGVWSDDNCYEGLKTNNIYGTYEFSDFPMDSRYGVKPNTHIPGAAMNKYLNDFADHFDLRDRIRFETRVLEVEKLSNGWRLLTKTTRQNHTDHESMLYTCKKLIMSTGLASNPNPISIPGQEAFGKPILSHADLPRRAKEVAKDPDINSVTIVGASKSGYDAVYLFASHGKKVDWIIRESGGGAVWMSTPWVSLPGKRVLLEHMATTRFFSWFSPCIWGKFDGYSWIRSFLHGTRFGRFLVHKFWEKMRMGTIDANKYHKEEALKHLEPQESLFWSGRVGILNYPSDIHDYLRSGQVKITKSDINSLSKDGMVHLGENTLKTDVLLATTGWDITPTIEYKPEGLDSDLGIPTCNLRVEDWILWDKLGKEADENLLSEFPYLREQPRLQIPYKKKLSPFRLYRGIVSPELTKNSDNSLAFIKMVHSTSNTMLVECQALWVYAYLNDELSIDQNDVHRQTAVVSRFGKLRYPCGFSSWYPEFIYDTMPYMDMLLSDLGLRTRRKPSVFREVFETYTIQDYKGLNREWKEKRLA